MNKLFVGFKSEVELPPGGFLFISDEVPEIYRSVIFDPLKDCFNPLKDITHKRARELANVLCDIYPFGNTTLTMGRIRRKLPRAFLESKRMDNIKADEEVSELIDDVLFSPVVRNMLCNPGNQFSFKKGAKVLARVNRAELGEFDAFVIGAFLIGNYPGTVVVTDTGFYGRDGHAALVRENRFIAHVNSLSDVPKELRKSLLSIKDKTARGCLFEDAELLAKYAGYMHGTNAFNDFVSDAMGSE